MSLSQETILKIEGMSCGHCKATIEKALSVVPGVVSASVNLEKKEALVTGNASREMLEKVVEDLGFDVV